MRDLVSYDDIASPLPAPIDPPETVSPGPPPRKRRKNNYRQGKKWGGHRPQNREDYEYVDENPPKKTRRDYGLEEESRQLTHEEVWDDSVLIHAWDAALEEYKALNGPEKKWKSEPVNKSPLWYNIPPESEGPSKSSVGPSFFMPSIPSVFASEGDVEEGEDDAPADPDNSQPVNFNTFVPQHDPSLSNAKHGPGDNFGNNATAAWRGVVPPPPAEMSTQVTPNEAFEHAMGAWYWAGYWTGVYHSSANKTIQRSETDDELEVADDAMVGNTEQAEEEDPNEHDEDSDLLPV